MRFLAFILTIGIVSVIGGNAYSKSFVKGKVPEPLSLEDDTSLSHCQNLILSAEGLSKSGQYQNAYDTYRSYIEYCAYLSNSWETFMDVGDMNTVRSNDMHRFEEYRDWLKKVLYYNLDTNFYCADVSEMLSTPTAITLHGTSDALLPHLSYSVTSGGTDPACATSQFSFSGILCGNGFNELVKGSGIPTLSVVSVSSLDSSECDRLQWAIHSYAQGGDNQKVYDTARYAVEHCATQNLFLPIWKDFGTATFAVQYISNDNNRWPPYREWLKKVLYLNMDSAYYCEDVVAIQSTMQYFNAERGYDRNGALAIIKFLMDSNRCSSFFEPNSFADLWKNTRNAQYQDWRDTSHAGHINPLDTTVPTLDELDLQILRGPQYAAVKDAFTPSTKTKLAYLTASENPFKEETTLRFGLADAEYMRIDIYDLLGNKLYSDSKVFSEGDEEWRIDGKSIARGLLYARLSTMGGEVKTVKLVHDK